MIGFSFRPWSSIRNGTQTLFVVLCCRRVPSVRTLPRICQIASFVSLAKAQNGLKTFRGRHVRVDVASQVQGFLSRSFPCDRRCGHLSAGYCGKIHIHAADVAATPHPSISRSAAARARATGWLVSLFYGVAVRCDEDNGSSRSYFIRNCAEIWGEIRDIGL